MEGLSFYKRKNHLFEQSFDGVLKIDKDLNLKLGVKKILRTKIKIFESFGDYLTFNTFAYGK